MPNEWIIDVLADLKAYAALNGLEATAAQLDEASLVALTELSGPAAPAGDGMGTATGGHEGEAGNVTHLFARRGLA